jgi:hypothetical protein
MVPSCRSIAVFAFRGNRARAFATAHLKALDEAKNRRGPGPSALDCLLFAGHAGVSMDGGATIYGFNPDGGVPAWQMMDQLKRGDAFPGVVRDDTSVFSAARKCGLIIPLFEIICRTRNFRISVRGLTQNGRRVSIPMASQTGMANATASPGLNASDCRCSPGV